MIEFDGNQGYFARAFARILNGRTICEYCEFWDEKIDTHGSIRLLVLLNKGVKIVEHIPNPRIEEVLSEQEINDLARLLGFQKVTDGSWPIDCNNFYASNATGLASRYADLWFDATTFPARPQ